MFVQHVINVSSCPYPPPNHHHHHEVLFAKTVGLYRNTNPSHIMNSSQNGLVSAQGHSSHRIYFLKVDPTLPLPRLRTEGNHCKYASIF